MYYLESSVAALDARDWRNETCFWKKTIHYLGNPYMMSNSLEKCDKIT